MEFTQPLRFLPRLFCWPVRAERRHQILIFLISFFSIPDVPDAPKNLAYYLADTTPVGTSIKFSAPFAKGKPILFYVVDYTINPVRSSSDVRNLRY